MSGALIAILFGAQLLTLEEAVHTAEQNQPQLRQAHANSEAARARADEARAPLLPQVSAIAAYQRTTANFTPRPGLLPTAFNQVPTGSSTSTFNFFNLGVTLNQLVWDFSSVDRFRSAKATARAQVDTEHATALQLLATVRVAFFAARAQRGLVTVARDTLANQDRHLEQIRGFVVAGTRPEIDLAQARNDRANAEVQKIQAENNYEVAKAQLNQAMGVERSIDYDVADEPAAPIAGEDQSLDALLPEALRARPELASLEHQIRAQSLARRATEGAYYPALGIASSLTDAGTSVEGLAWNWNATATLTWSGFQGFLTFAQVAEATATLHALEAQRDQLRQQIRLDVEQARLGVRAAKATVGAAQEALTNATDRLALAEGRYRAGVGNVIELGDAQVALTTAGGQRIQADYNLASARAQLSHSLGRK